MQAIQREQLLKTLKARFEHNMNRHDALKWAAVQAKLKAGGAIFGDYGYGKVFQPFVATMLLTLALWFMVLRAASAVFGL